MKKKMSLNMSNVGAFDGTDEILIITAINSTNRTVQLSVKTL